MLLVLVVIAASPGIGKKKIGNIVTQSLPVASFFYHARLQAGGAKKLQTHGDEVGPRECTLCVGWGAPVDLLLRKVTPDLNSFAQIRLEF